MSITEAVLLRWAFLCCLGGLSFQGGIAVHIVDKPWKGCCVGSLVSGRSAESSPFSSASFIQRRAPPLTIAFIPSSIPINKMLMPKRRSTASPRPIPKEISSSSSDSNLSPFSSPKDQSAQKEPRNPLSLQGIKNPLFFVTPIHLPASLPMNATITGPLQRAINSHF